MSSIKNVLQSEKIRLSNLKEGLRAAFDNNLDLVYWYERPGKHEKNFGDDMNPWLYEKITGRQPVNARKVINFRGKTVYSCIGSILGFTKSPHLVIWGSGFVDESKELKAKPKDIRAVRGPLTRQKILDQNIDCPEVYGDPALVIPKFYQPNIEKKYRLGIVAHYGDKNTKNYKEFIKNLPSDVLLINVESTVEEVVDDILKCESIASSSLHGIIVADAYKIPSLYIKFSNNVTGGSFKFKDYMEGVNREYRDPLYIDGKTSVEDIYHHFYEYSLDVDIDKLLDVCPFK